MKALVIIIATVVVLAAAKVVEVLVDRKRLNSVGGKANNLSKGIRKYDISDENSVKDLVNEYKDMAD